MFTKIALTILLVTLAMTASAAVKIGERAPDFTGIDTAGNKVTLSDFRGRPVILEWTNNGCPYVMSLPISQWGRSQIWLDTLSRIC
jgi:hypothetical protein